MSDQPPPQQPPVPQQPPGDGGAQPSDGVSIKRTTLYAIIGVLFLLLAGLAYVLLTGDDGDDEFTQAAGEVFLEPANAVGPDPFTEEVETTEVDPDQMVTPSTTTTTGPTSTTATPGTAPPPGVAAIPTQIGSTPGLYGGTQDRSRCDPQQMKAFLLANPDKAAAWVAALNTDPTLRWAGGTSLTVGDIGAYIDELTPITLISDTRVTNYGFSNGRPTPRQSVLQAGTAVLVDRYGVPRAKCNCGNPLTTPTAVSGTVIYTGDPWPTFQPTTVVVVQETTVIIDVFILVNIQTGGVFTRPATTTGGQDATQTPGTTPPQTTPTTQPPATAPPTTAPPATAPPQTVLTGDFCQAVQQYDQQADQFNTESEQGIDEFTAWLRAAFLDLQRLAPDELQADIALFLAAVERGPEALFLDDPQLEAAGERFEEYVRTVCGYDPDAN